MAEADGRATLERLIRERGEDYAGLSRLIGRNAAYVQQYIRRGIPRRLAEADRRVLAQYFGVSEVALGAPEPFVSHAVVEVPRLAVGASAGSGALPGGEGGGSRIAFDAKWLRRLAPGGSDGLSIIAVEGDSMAPTLADGDEIFVNRSDGADRLRDGIYVLRIEEALLVKRVTLNPAGGSLAITSDNSAYPAWPDCPLGAVDIVGRVVWAGRKVG